MKKTKIIAEIGEPDIYFSYGIPVFKDIAKINWFHISNALTLKTKNISLPLGKRIQMWILKNRILLLKVRLTLFLLLFLIVVFIML